MQKELEPHEFIERGVGKHDGDEFAEFNGISRSTYEKWGRKPASDEAPNSTGLINPIKRLDRIFDYFLLNNPSWAVALVERYLLRLRRFREMHNLQPLTPGEYRARLTKVIEENSDVLKALVAGAPLADLQKEVSEYQKEIDELMVRLEQSERGSINLQPIRYERKRL
jgi:hypothetical protein